MIRLVLVVTLRELARRRAASGLVLVLPLVFFAVRVETPWTALRLLAMGLGWSVATLALFIHVSARSLDRRLVIAGAGPVAVHLGRQLAVAAFGVVAAVGYAGLVALTIGDDLHRAAPVLLMLLLTVAIAAPLGALVAALVPRELEGALLLLAVMAVQVLVDPADEWTRVLPLWGARELATYVVEPVGSDYLTRAVTHSLAVAVVLTTISLLIGVRRLRVRPLPEPVTPVDAY